MRQGEKMRRYAPDERLSINVEVRDKARKRTVRLIILKEGICVMLASLCAYTGFASQDPWIFGFGILGFFIFMMIPLIEIERPG